MIIKVANIRADWKKSEIIRQMLIFRQKKEQGIL